MIPFAKTEAHGNDFLVVAEEHATQTPSALAIAMCDRLRGIGADGLILYRGENDRFVMTLFNSDGSSAEISGNAAWPRIWPIRASRRDPTSKSRPLRGW